MRAPLFVVAALLAAGCLGGAPAVEKDVIEERTRLSPHPIRGYWNETNLRVEGGQEVSWSFEATAPLAWDVHTHEGEEVVILANGTHAETRGAFTPPSAGVYSLFLQNMPGQGPVDVTFRIEGEFDRA